jgi:hypothetical protein
MPSPRAVFELSHGCSDQNDTTPEDGEDHTREGKHQRYQLKVSKFEVVVLKHFPSPVAFAEQDFILRLSGVDHYLANETLPLHRIDMIQLCRNSFLSPPLELVPRPPPEVMVSTNTVPMYANLLFSFFFHLEHRTRRPSCQDRF